MTRAGTKLANRDHRVPLSDRAIEILRTLPREKRNAHLFVGGKERAGLSNMALNELIKDMHNAKVKAGGRGWVDPKQQDRRVVPHGVARSSFKDWAVSEAHFPDILSEFALAHVDKDKVRAAYLRDDLLARRVKLMGAWAAYCARPPIAEVQRHADPGRMMRKPLDISDLDAADVEPTKRARGRPPENIQRKLYRRIRLHVLGHDTTTEIGYAGWRYDRLRKFFRKKGWHIGRPHWRDDLLNAVARKYGVSPTKLADYDYRGPRKKI